MTKRRGRGEWGLSWDKSRECWTAETTVGYTAAGKRIVLKARDRTKTVAKDKLRQKVNDYQDGITKEEANYTVAHAVEDWLTYGSTAAARRPSRRVVTCVGTSHQNWEPESFES